MRNWGLRTLTSSSALPLILALGSFGTATPVLAACTTSGATTTCTSANPNPWTSTVGTGRPDNNRTVEMLNGSQIRVTNRNAISLGDNANITLRTGSIARADSNSGSGNYGTGPQTIEFNSNGTLLIEEGAQVIVRGTSGQAEAINVHGVGNRIENHGTISGQPSAALWFEDLVTVGPKNVVDNYGVIEQINGGTVIGSSGGAGIDFYNHTDARVQGSLAFSSGNDSLYFFANSVVTGNINGGGGTNTLTLEGAAGTSDTLAGALTNFQTLTKDGVGRWTITGPLTGFQSTTVNLGTLALTGDNTNYSAGVLINPLGVLEARAQSLPEQTNPVNNVNNIRNNGMLRFAQPDDGVYLGQIVGSGAVEKIGAGVTTLAPSTPAGNTYAGGTRIREGTIAVSANSALGAAAGGLTFDGGTLRTTATFTMARPTEIQDDGGTFETTGATTLTEAGVVTGIGRLTKTGTGTLALTGNNTWTGGTQIDAGAVQVSSDANLGAATGPLGMNGGTLRSTATFATARQTTLGASGGTFQTQTGTLTHNGDIGGAGALTKTGAGTLVLNQFNSYAGGTNINAGVVQISTSANLGAAGAPLSFDGGTLRNTSNVTMARAATLNAGGGTFETAAGTTLGNSGNFTGAGALTKTADGTMILTGAATHTGGTTIAAGVLQLGAGGTGGSLTGDIVDNGTLVFNRSDTLDVPGVISGSGQVIQAGTGDTRLLGDNSYAGTTTVQSGGLYVNGVQTGQGDTFALAGATLGGSGAIGGAVTIEDGATLSPGDVGTVPGTLTIAGSLALRPNAILNYSFGQANVPGGALNDLTNVGGALSLDGTLNVVTTPGGSFDPGVYRVFNYAGAMEDRGLEIGTIPSPDFYVQTSVANQVNLVNTTGLTLNFWDGDAGPKDNGVINGGDGTWQNSDGNDNWTDLTGLVNAPFSDGSFAVFTGAPGTVTVDDSLGAVTVSGMQYAVDGYVVIGDDITLVGAPDSVIRVGDGTGAGAAMTTTITADLTGASGLTKTDLGTLVLDGAKSYVGDTAINGGVVEIAGDASLGTGDLAFDDGTLRTTASFELPRATTLNAGGGTVETETGTLAYTGVIGGAGGLTKTGTGTLTLSGANAYAGGTQIDEGVVEIATNANLGAAAGALGIDGATLRTTADVAMSRATTLGAGGGVFETTDGTTLAQGGDISGDGSLAKTEGGTMVLIGDATHTGGTAISEGTLRIGAGATTGSLAGNVANNGALVFDRSNTLDMPGIISGTGSVTQAGTGDTRLLGENAYEGVTTVASGGLYVIGDQSAATGETTAEDGATLGGTGLIGGDVVIADGATLAPGDVGATPGTLGIAGSLTLGSGSILSYSFGQANVVGGPLNDLTEVGGDLTLDGTLNVVTSPGGSFDPGIYRVFNYAGDLEDNGLTIGTIPSPDFYVQTSVANQVNLINTQGLTLTFWDGDAGPKNDGVVNGGDGVWQSPAGNDDWTNDAGTINAPWTADGFAIFMGAAGDVTVDDSLGAVTASGMQFITDGYLIAGDPITLTGAPASVIRVGDGTPAGAATTATISAELTGDSGLTKTDLGTLVLEGANSYAGVTSIDGGVLEIAENASLGTGDLAFDAGTLRTTASFTLPRTTTLAAGGGTIETTTGTLDLTGAIGGAGGLTKTGAGTLVLGAANSFAGGVQVDAGVVEVAADAGLGAASGPLGLDDGTLRATAGFAMDRATTLGAGGGTVETAGAAVTVVQSGAIAGDGALTKTGAGTLTLAGDAAHAGGTTIAAGTLQVGDGGATGTLAGDVANAGVLAFDRADALAMAGAISGSGLVRQQGDGTTTLSGANTYAGGTEILGGTLQVAGDGALGAAAGPLLIDGAALRNTAAMTTARATTLAAGGGTLDTAAALSHAGAISGPGGLTKTGAATLTLTGANSYAGPTLLDAGALYVNGDQSAATGATTAATGTRLGGTGTIGGDVAIAAGATLAPGAEGDAPGALSIGGDLGLVGGSILDYSFGQANVVGGPFNDLINVAGDLTLDGTLNVVTTTGGSFDPGIYRVINYAGAMTDNGLTIGTIPSPDFYVQTSVANQVNLINTAGLTLTFWDGDAGPKNDGVINGGDGSWQASAGNDDWTDENGAINAPWADGDFAIFMGARGDVTVDTSLGAVAATGMQFITDGYVLDGDAITLVGAPDSIIRVGDGTLAGAGATATIAAELTGDSRLLKTDLGTLVLSGVNTYTGGTSVEGGVLSVAADTALGAAGTDVRLENGTLRATASFATDRPMELSANGGTIETATGVTLAASGDIDGPSSLTKTGAGTLTLTGDATHAGGTTISAGILQVGDGGTDGTLAGDIVDDAVLALDRADDLAMAGAISGTGLVRQQGAGTTTLSGANSYAGGTEILAGTLQVAGDGNLGAATGTLLIDGATLRNTGAMLTARATTLGAGGGTFDTAAALTHSGTIAGAGGLTKTGAAALTLTGANAYAGPTALTAGGLYINGDQSAATGATTAASGTRLGGTGTIGGDVAIASGATLAPGDASAAPGTLSIGGDLGLVGGSILDYSFGQANVVGGPLNDLTEVAGDLTLDGTLNVTTAPGGSFDPGIYRVISYGGALTNNGLAIGTIPSPDFYVQTSVANQVNLVNRDGLLLTYWDGDAGPKDNGVINGGDGSWQASAGNDNWTEETGRINAPWASGGFAIFMGARGDVTVDDSLGAVEASGMQFLTDGYVVAGDDITLVGDPESVIRVGDGTAAGADVTATISAVLAGDTRLTKTDLGTLVLEGDNTYAGGTAVEGGVLSVAADTALGAASGGLGLDGGTLQATASFATDRATTLGAKGGTIDTGADVTLAQAGDIAGAGALTKAGTGTLTLTGAATHTGGTTIDAGVLQVGDGGTTGTLAGDVLNDGTLVFDRSNALAIAGDVSGAGAVRQQGAGVTTLSGTNAYTGTTSVTAGTLQAGRANAFSAASAHAVGAAGTLYLADFDQQVARLSNAGRVSLGQVAGTRLVVAGDYVGDGGVLHFTTDLGGDDSATDVMVVEGDTSGTGTVEVANGKGTGAQTVNGIKLIDVAGASDADFTLAGELVVNGRPAVIGGVYAYSLYQGGVATPTDGDWYLRSAPVGPNPGPPTVNPAVPTYEAYPYALLALNGLPTMQERLGNRYWKDAGAPAGLATQAAPTDVQLAGGAVVEQRRAWARIEGTHANLEPDVEVGRRPTFDMDIWRLQVGIDREVREIENGVLIGGLTFTAGSVDTDVSSPDGDGGIDTTGYGVGGSLTWLRDDDLYVDGQLQLMWYDSDLRAHDLGKLVDGNDGFGYALGVEVGKRIPVKADWTLTPQAQVYYSSVSFDSFRDPYGVRVTDDSGATMPLRLGLAADQERAWLSSKGDARRTHFYGIANVYYDLIGDTEVVVDGTGLSTEADRAWGSLGVGGTYTWDDGKYGVYGEGLVSTSLESFGDSYANSFTAGFRIAW
ncbi:autotransporter-associated beta strand repeat-containing protein [Amaricoccus sp.]|uniref:autotransporter-associated beta strand repeat-containing protein n=1 Tax=Amaricoccus sp. TaxID=1872485 RepID=UPI001B491AA8|nr:autotransporter-associated beta strand repeat-containing protein [Amaricoccus sp.]MBP7000598.1 autotransporter-associated beta strand repeat-containing protein [Amaricoccus sp.]